MKQKFSLLLFTTIFILMGGLITISLSSCDNFLNGADVKKEIEEAIAYNNALECRVIFRADSGTGEFLGSLEQKYKVGYESEVQFELNTEDYVFKGLEAVSHTDKSESRADSVVFTEISKDVKKGKYKYKIKLIKEAKDVLIHPVCVAIPKITEILPKLESNGCDQDSIIKITFNKPINIQTFKSEYISIFADDDLTEYFEEPKFTSDNKTLIISPKSGKLILPPDGQKAMLNIQVNYDFRNMKDSDGLGISENGAYLYKINKNFGSQKKVNVLVRSDTAYGSFFSDGEKECTVGYAIDVQFTLKKNDYKFLDFEAVSSIDNSLSRADCISLENKDFNDETGVYKAKVRVISEQNDILIRPKCLAYPAVISHIPATAADVIKSNTPIELTFNMPMEETSVTQENSIFNFDNISILYTDSAKNNTDMTPYFEKPVFDAQKKKLTIKPKTMLLKNFIDNLHFAFLEMSVSFEPEIIVTQEGYNLAIKQDAESNFTVRYSPEVETTAPVKSEFFLSRELKSLDIFENQAELTACTKFTTETLESVLDNTDYDGLDIEERLLQNRVTNFVYVYGKYFDKDSGVNKVLIKQDDNSPHEYFADSQNAEFLADENGYTCFCIKFELDDVNCTSDLTVTVVDACNNVSAEESYYIISK